MNTQKITPFLWFDKNAEEAVNFYMTVFKNGTIKSTSRYNKESATATGQTESAVMTMAFTLNGQDFVALNGGPHFKFTEAVSFVINCQNQEEVDHYWNKLRAGGQESQCGWLKDKFGLSWQVVPDRMVKMLQDKDPAKSKRVMHAMMQMKKIDLSKLEEAYAGS